MINVLEKTIIFGLYQPLSSLPFPKNFPSKKSILKELSKISVRLEKLKELSLLSPTLGIYAHYIKKALTLPVFYGIITL